MNAIGWCFALSILLAQVPAADPAASAPPPMIARPQAADASGAAVPQPDKVRMVAVQAQNKGQQDRQIAQELNPLKGILERLPYDTFDQVSAQEQTLVPGQKTQMPINDIYSLFVKPEDTTEAGGVKLEARIEMLQNGALVNALKTSCNAAPGKALVFRGMKLNEGELVVVMTLVQNQNGQGQSQQPQQDQQDQQKDEQQQQQQQEQQQQDQQKDDQQEKQAQQEQSQEAQQTEGEKENEPKDMHEIEALLKSLEETDRREQPQVFNQRERFESPQEWW